ncbi:MAG: D-alanine--poly(phosphoribitol) ligase [Candidimonas sp.]|nr:MAG: D-alanine--poly(phosphoribitol) ligase [Candidimonas sp.]
MHFDPHDMRFTDTERGRERCAVAGSDRDLSWGELEAQTRRWMMRARDLGARADTPIVLWGHKQAAFFTAMTACLELGAPFVPVDTIYPESRRRRIADLVGAGLLYRADADAFEPTGHDATPLAEKGLAYVLFTSGSTGEPKGVQIGRESVELLARWLRTDFQLGAAPVFMNQAPFSFDLSMFEVFGTLASGGTCVLNSREQIRDGRSYIERLAHRGITCWVSTPSFAHQQLLEETFSAKTLPSLHTFLFCGEVLPRSVCQRLKRRFPCARILNTYGPTEATVATTLVEIDQKILDECAVLPVGYAKPDATIETRDGEICIIGNHVMRGYLNRPDLNQSRMFRDASGRRGLRTGDLGRLDAGGLLWCEGRRDDQVKLNGYRIELAEISSSLQALNGIKNATCLALRRPDNTVARLVGFVELKECGRPDTAKPWTPYPIKNWKPALAHHLPAYMLPSEIIVVDALPTSINHKIDRKTLLDTYKVRAVG